MSMKVMNSGGGGSSSFLGQRLAHRKRLLHLFLRKDEQTRSRLLEARGPLRNR